MNYVSQNLGYSESGKLKIKETQNLVNSKFGKPKTWETQNLRNSEYGKIKFWETLKIQFPSTPIDIIWSKIPTPAWSLT